MAVKAENVCQDESQAASKVLAVGECCGMRHEH